MSESKVDGFRAMRFAGTDGVARLWSRNGHPIEGTGHILSRLSAMEEAAGERFMFDGEFIVDGTLAATKAWFEKGWKLGAEAGVFHLFDGMPFREWRAGGTDQPLYERKNRLQELFDATESAGDGWTWREGSRGRPDAIAVAWVPDDWMFDAAHVVTEARRVWAIGGEGLMLKDPLAPYRRLRSDSWQKVKPGGPWWRAMRAGSIAA